MFGMLVAVGSVVTYLVVIAERLLLSGWREGVYTLWDRDILQFFLTGMVLFGLGLIGEYVGRIYQQVRQRPRFMIQAVLEQETSGVGVEPRPAPPAPQ
jgi:undecaprenyl-phosphate 4-deoxy-4-formamido-L-arabinose transferase